MSLKNYKGFTQTHLVQLTQLRNKSTVANRSEIDSKPSENQEVKSRPKMEVLPRVLTENTAIVVDRREETNQLLLLLLRKAPSSSTLWRSLGILSGKTLNDG